MPEFSLQTRLQSGQPLFSIEFFPPKSEAAAQKLLRTAEALKVYAPDFVSITYGAGGGTRTRTLKYARHLCEDYDYTVMPHLTCVGHSRAELHNIINEFREAGLDQIMALRGDPPKGEKNFTPHPDGLHYANELVDLIHQTYPTCTVGVAGYPETHPEVSCPDTDLKNLKRKIDAGAHFVTTQLFFDNELYFDFVARARQAGITIPILPGLMCPASPEPTFRFCEMCGTSVPETLREKLRAAGDTATEDNAAAVEAAAVEWTYQQAHDLLKRGAPGIHFYILNRKRPTAAIMDRLQSAGFYTE